MLMGWCDILNGVESRIALLAGKEPRSGLCERRFYGRRAMVTRPLEDNDDFVDVKSNTGVWFGSDIRGSGKSNGG